MTAQKIVDRRYDFALIFDVADGNPNGDPDAGNAPRIDPETGNGLVTDVCLKRKIRNYICLARTDKKTGQPAAGYDIYVKHQGVLNARHERAFKALGLKSDAKGKEKSGQVSAARAWMCQTFFDIRMFGAVMNTEVNCGQVRGPVQLSFARSVDPISSLEQAITRVAVTNKSKAEDQVAKYGAVQLEMGRKEIVPYGLYVGYGFVSPHLAADTGFTQADLDLLWEALKNMFEYDRSATRGMMASRKLYVFEHASALGNAPAHSLFERIEIARKDAARPARAFSHYAVSLRKEGMPQGITVQEML